MSPIGGVIADRGKKQRIMFWLDAATTVLIVLFIAAARGFSGAIVPIIIAKLIALNVIQGIYMPTTMAGIPFLVPADKLVPANAAANMVFSLSNTIGPAIGGILFGLFGLFPILVISVVVFAVTAIIDLFIRIPYKKQKPAGSAMRMIKSDLSECARFGMKEKPVLGKVALILFFFGTPSVAFMIVGLPVLVTQTLGKETGMLGISQGIMMGGGLLGGFLAGALEKKLTIKNAHLVLFACSLNTVPIGLVFLLNAPVFAAYVIITLCGAVVMLTTQIVNIQVLAFVQEQTPPELVGKIIAVVMALVIGAYPVGQLLFGVLFEQFADLPHLVIFAAAVMSASVAIGSRKHFKGIA